MLDLNQVMLFVEVVRAGSFSAAARQLGLPANTLSRRVGQLETHLDTRLMQRSTRKLTLTAAGRAFFERVEPSVASLFEAEREIVDRTEVPSGVVRVAAPADFMSVFRADWLLEFLTRHPKVRLDFVLDDARVDLIANGIDVALRADPEPLPHYFYRRAMSRHSRLVASPEYLQARGKPGSVAELKHHDCLTGSSRHASITWSLLGSKGVEEVQVSGRFRANNAHSLMRACVAGLGIALLPEILIAPELDAGRLLPLLPAYRRKGEDYQFVFPSRRQIPLAVSSFADYAGEKMRSLFATEVGAVTPSSRAKSRRVTTRPTKTGRRVQGGS
jgi:DNA-binding transcriptional LysR family regulator